MPVTVKTQSSSAPYPSAANHIKSLSSEHISIKRIPSSSKQLCFKEIPSKHIGIGNHAQAGFTLVEIVVVVVILSIFAGMMSLSVGSSESRKNRAFYEHLTDSLSYVRLLAAEGMQPMGLSLQADKQGQVTPVIVTLSNPYIGYQTQALTTGAGDSTPKNSMELSADLSGVSGTSGNQPPTPSWELEPAVSLPTLPAGVSLSIESLETNMSGIAQTQTLQPWFRSQTVPQVLWFGNGQAAPVTIEVRHDSSLVGEVITIMPDGSIKIGHGR